jgi:hypothetical protein
MSHKDELFSAYRHGFTEKGESIFFPKEYLSYNDFKTNHVEKSYLTTLLIKRLSMLIHYKKLLINKKSDDYEIDSEILYVKDEILLNQHALYACSAKDSLDSLSFTTNMFDNKDELNNHVFDITKLLNERIRKGFYVKKGKKEIDVDIQKLNNFIEKMQSNEECKILYDSTDDLPEFNFDLCKGN